MTPISCRSLSPRHWAPLAATAVLAAAMVEAAVTRVRAAALHHAAVVLERRFEPQPSIDVSAIGGIVSLGGSPTRAREAIALARRFPELPVIASGPGPEEAAVFLAATDIASRLTIDFRAQTTFENATFSHDVAIRANRISKPWLLVTSDVHMPRAVGVFRKIDMKVVAWPVDEPQWSHKTLAEATAHEVIGLLAYRVLGRSIALLPGPAHATPNPSRPTADTCADCSRPPRPMGHPTS